jgi:hypothetical protein
MPRDGTTVYSIPSGTEGIPDQTIESAKYNGFAHDIEQDLNHPRPILSGGTGATSAEEAAAKLGFEKSTQEVSNFDGHLYFPGSFYAKTTATPSPVLGHAFVGYVYSSDPPAYPPANLNIVVHAYDQSDTAVPGRTYVREKKAGTWTAPWTLAYPPINNAILAGDTQATTQPNTDNDTSVATTAFVKNTSVQRTGDTMTGLLTTAASTGTIAGSAGTSNALQVYGGGTTNASYMSFHRPGAWAAHLGVDSDNQFKVGGWSMGANAYRLLHEGLSAPTVSGDPSTGTGIATKNYVDTRAPGPATYNELWANSGGNKWVNGNQMWLATSMQQMNSNCQPNFDAGVNFYCNPGVGVVYNPVGSPKSGQAGVFFIIGGPAHANWGDAYKWPGGTKPTTTGGWDMVSYVVWTAGHIMCTFTKNHY